MSLIFVLTAERRPALPWRIISILTLVHPRAAVAALSPQESVSRNFQSPTAPYKFRSLATPKGGARVCGGKALHYHLSLYQLAELAAGAATPYPAAPDFPLFRGQNKPLYVFLLCHKWHTIQRP